MITLYLGVFVIAFVVSAMVSILASEKKASEQREKAYQKLDKEIALFYAKNKR